MAYALYRGTRLGLALQEALGELEEFEQISPSVKSAVLRKFDETITDKLENEVDTSLMVRADRLWSFRWWKFIIGNFHLKFWTFVIRFCDSVWQLLLKNVEFLTVSGQSIVKVDGKVRQAKYLPSIFYLSSCNRLKLWHVTPGNLRTKDKQKQVQQDSCRTETFNASSKAGTKVLVEILKWQFYRYTHPSFQCLCTYNLKREINIMKK